MGVTDEQFQRHVTICNDAYLATRESHAVVLCTEWDEFVVGLLVRDTTGVI